MVNSAMLDVGFQGHRKVSNIGRAELYQSLNIGGAANPFHYCDFEILVGLQSHLFLRPWDLIFVA